MNQKKSSVFQITLDVNLKGKNRNYTAMKGTMKKIVLGILFTVISGCVVFADDSYIGSISGSPSSLIKVGEQKFHMSDNPPDISMESEHVIITMHNDYYSVDATFYFYNGGSEVTVLIGFPDTNGTSRSDGLKYPDLDSFKTYVDGNQVPYVSGEDDIDLSESYDIDRGAPSGWNVKEVHFNKSQRRTTRVTYNASYGFANAGLSCGHDAYLGYIYGTGRNWKDSIGEIIVDCDLSDSPDICIRSISFNGDATEDNCGKPQSPSNFKMEWFTKDTLRLTAFNVDPKADYEELSLEMHDYGEVHENVYSYFADDFPATKETYRLINQKAIDKTDLRLLSSDQLRIKRNDFFAVHGRVFRSPDLQSYYKSIPSYKPNHDYTDSLLTDSELHSIDEIIQEEKLR
jgi:hypothetical protein